MLALKTFAVWLFILCLAVANGALRESVLIPALGQVAALVSSGVTLCVLIALVAVAFVRLQREVSPSEGFGVGLSWLVLTLVFEFAFGRYVQHKPWSELLQAYTFQGGNIWPVVLVVTLLAPWMAAWRQSRHRRAGRPGDLPGLRADGSVRAGPVPHSALLHPLAAAGAYIDCYCVTVPGSVSLAQFIGAFYTTPAFRLERWILAQLARLPSTDAQVHALARGEVDTFAAWHVQARAADQVLLAAGRTRSWLMVAAAPAAAASTVLSFGSGIVPRRRGGLGWQFTVLLGFHKLYSRVLLASAARRLVRHRVL